MPFESSPSLDEYREGIPPEKSPRGKGLWVVIGALILLALVLGVSQVMRTQQFALLAGSGTVEGTVVDEAGKPTSADVFVLGIDLLTHTDASGHFELSGIPAGKRSVVVARDGAAREFPVEIAAGQSVNLNQIQWLPTVVPTG